ncbi:hypothetical protein RRG08_046097 [Elysia crispata]|uniref:Globin n=1 Tax=Elysia crispata TaxID=231223 RepID=A0AAE1CSL2_9GAST|nr:hypothetical protein RRG08_046097 [Elysia crispata]
MGTACTCQAPVPVQIDKGATILSSKDAGQIILSWTQLADFGDIKELALHFFEQLFETYPYMEKYFEFTGGKHNPSKKTFKMAVHSLVVMRRMGTFVGYIEHRPLLVSLMEKLARSHIKKGVKCEDMEKFTGVFTTFLVGKVGKPYAQKDVKEAWERFFSSFLKVYSIIEEETGTFWI